jgi:GH25 family lysozyme M1 (1,4-beta-N-acetylmuramidase)
MNFDFHNIVGYDISTWQDSPTIPGNVDFQKMKAGGASFVIVKAGQGNWADPDFATSWKNAKGVLPRASYFYFDNRYPPDTQARKYFDIIRQDLEGMCWLDLEDRNTGVYAGFRNWYDFLEELKRVYPGVRAGIYTNFFYWVEYMTYATRAERDYFLQYPLWLASYPVDPFNPPYSTMMVPLPWLECLILQTGTPAIGLDAGVESKEIDFNQFNGDANKFSKYFKVIDGASVPEEEVTMAIADRWQVTWEAGCNKRPMANTSNTPVGIIPTGTEFDVVAYFVPAGVPVTQECWGKLTDDYWVALTYASQPRAVQVSTPPPAAPVDEVTVSVEADIVATINGKPYHGVVMFDNVQLRPVE